MNKFQLTGGARIGTANATWPFASLTVTKDRLDLDASIIGNCSFLSTDIIAIESYYMILFIGQGIKIKHKVQKYNSSIIFWTFTDPKEVIKEIRQTGFLDNGTMISEEVRNQVIEKQKLGGFPFKTSAIIVVVLLWNIPILMDIVNNNKRIFPFKTGSGIVIALSLLLSFLFLTLISAPFRKLVLKEGRDIKEISKFIYFLMILLGFMLSINLLIKWNT